MSEAYLSEYEKIYLLHGVQGETKLIATVKAEIDEPEVNAPNHGKIDFLVDCSANANPEFQGRGGENIASKIVNTLNNIFSVNNFDLSQLCISEGKKCWHLYVDIVLLEYCGNLYDACVLAVKLALNKTRLPKLIIKSDDEGQIEIDFNDNSSECVYLKADQVPYAITVNKIGQHYVIDADLKEETVTKVRLVLGFDSKGNIRFGNKDGFGSLDPDTLFTIIDVAKSASKYLHECYLKQIK